jgi:inorganic pyrophosphatase
MAVFIVNRYGILKVAAPELGAFLHGISVIIAANNEYIRSKFMSYDKLSSGDKAPEVVNVLIENQRGQIGNKYEFDKEFGVIMLDRVNNTELAYPADYGFIPKTLCEDGDPLDALLVINHSVALGVVVPSRPIGVFYMIDDGEADEKLLCVAADDVSMKHITTVDDLGDEFKRRVEHFFTHYKDWKNGWKGVAFEHKGWGDVSEAKKVVEQSIARAS